jgi:uncharacterized phage protein gp47/JayE
MAGVYITDDGFIKRTSSDIKASLEAQYQTIFGNDIDLDPDGAFGQDIGMKTKMLSEIWDALEELWTCRNPDQATGVCLDNIAVENAIERLKATYTTVQNVLLYGDEGTIILAGKKAKKPSDIVNYVLDKTVIISKTSARFGKIEVTDVIESNTYSIIINSTTYSYVAEIGDDEDDILNGLKNLIEAGNWTGTINVINKQLSLIDLIIDFNFDIIGDLKIINIASAGDFTCDTIGVNILPVNSLTEIVTPVTGWDSLNNFTAGVTGRKIESDEDFRIRREQSIISGNATDESIRSAILNNVASVSSCQVFSNRGDVIDGEGRPPHSFEVIVEGGTNRDIALEIWNKMPAGIQPFGNEFEIIKDSQGHTQTIYFSRPEPVYIFVEVQRNFNIEENYPANGDDLIKEAIVKWSLISTNISVGKDVIRGRIAIPVYTIPGINGVNILLDSSTSLPYSPTETEINITITDRQLAVFSTDRIKVTTLP